MGPRAERQRSLPSGSRHISVVFLSDVTAGVTILLQGAMARSPDHAKGSHGDQSTVGVEPSSASPPPLEEPDSGPRPFAWEGVGDVLLADDEPTVRHVAARALQRLGFTVISCANGREAVEIFGAEPARWKLVVLDLTMPVMAGDEALERILAIRPEIAALLCSGYSEEDVRDRFGSLGRVAFLPKPFTVRALSEAVRAVLGPPD